MAKRSMRAMDVRVSASSANWAAMTSIDADVYGVETGGGERNVGEAFSADQDYPHICSGKRAMEEVTFNCLFDDGGSGAWHEVRGIHTTAGGAIYVRWAPEGSTSGAYGFYTGPAICTECAPPPGNVEDGECIGFSFSVACQEVVSETL